MSTRGSVSVAIANRYVGVSERPPGSNDGPQVRAWQEQAGERRGLARATYRRQPWCAMFLDAVAVVAGLDLPLALTSPSTAVMAAEARRLGILRGPDQTWPPGSYMIKDGVHVDEVERDRGDGTAEGVGGNVSDAVRATLRRKRDFTGAIVHPQILEETGPRTEVITVYWWEKADRIPKTSRAYTFAKFRTRARKRQMKVAGREGWRFREFSTGKGKRRRYFFQLLDPNDTLDFEVFKSDGEPWEEQENRDASMHDFAVRTGERVRPRSRRITRLVEDDKPGKPTRGRRTTGGRTD